LKRIPPNQIPGYAPEAYTTRQKILMIDNLLQFLRVSCCLTAHQYNTGYSVPLMVECRK